MLIPLLLLGWAWATASKPPDDLTTEGMTTITTIYQPAVTVTSTVTVTQKVRKQEIEIPAENEDFIPMAELGATEEEVSTTIAGGIFFINAVQVLGTAAFKQIFDALNAAQIAEITTVDYTSVQYTDTCAQVITSVYT